MTHKERIIGVLSDLKLGETLSTAEILARIETKYAIKTNVYNTLQAFKKLVKDNIIEKLNSDNSRSHYVYKLKPKEKLTTSGISGMASAYRYKYEINDPTKEFIDNAASSVTFLETKSQTGFSGKLFKASTGINKEDLAYVITEIKIKLSRLDLAVIKDQELINILNTQLEFFMAGYNNTMPESWNRLLATRDIRNSEYENVLKSL
jgi:hypothetical protein